MQRTSGNLCTLIIKQNNRRPCADLGRFLTQYIQMCIWFCCYKKQNKLIIANCKNIKMQLNAENGASRI